MSGDRKKPSCLKVCLVIFVIAGLGFSTFLYFAVQDSLKPPPANCGMNLRMIGLALHMYAQDNDKQFPSTLAEVVHPDYLNRVDEFNCPSSDKKKREPLSISSVNEQSDYFYVAGLNYTNVPDIVQMFDLPDNHDGAGANILFSSGYVEWHPNDSSERNFWTVLESSGITKEMVLNATNRIIRVGENEKVDAAKKVEPARKKWALEPAQVRVEYGNPYWELGMVTVYLNGDNLKVISTVEEDVATNTVPINQLDADSFRVTVMNIGEEYNSGKKRTTLEPDEATVEVSILKSENNWAVQYAIPMNDFDDLTGGSNLIKKLDEYALKPAQ